MGQGIWLNRTKHTLVQYDTAACMQMDKDSTNLVVARLAAISRPRPGHRPPRGGAVLVSTGTHMIAASYDEYENMTSATCNDAVMAMAGHLKLTGRGPSCRSAAVTDFVQPR